MRYLFAAMAAALALCSPAAAKPVAVKALQTWSGTMPPGVPPLFQSSVADTGDLQRAWTMCQVQGTPPSVDFAKHIVLVAVRGGSGVRFASLTLDNGKLRTNVVVTAGKPGQQACALALVNRAGVTSVDGVPVGK